jgi:hypothetical protein
VLGLEDLYQPLSHHRAKDLGTKLEIKWNEEVKNKRAKNKKPILMDAGLRVFGPKLALYGIFLLLIEICFKITAPLLLGTTKNINEAHLFKIIYFGRRNCSFLWKSTELK